MKAPLIILCAVGLVGGVGAWAWRQQAAGSAASLAEVKARPSAAVGVGAARRPLAAVPKAVGQGDRAASGRADAVAAAGEVGSGVAGAAVRPPVPAGLGDGELQRRAARVEQEANHDLAQLVGLLGIDEAQQDRIFETLVRHTPGWVPSLQAVGAGAAVAGAVGSAANPVGAVASDGGTLLDAIAADLTPDQQVELANEELDRQEWWEAIIAQLLPASEVPAVGGAVDAVVPAAAETLGPAESKVGEEPMVLE